MRILLISMHSLHATRWIENLEGSGHELFWFDITAKGPIDTLETATQFTGWKKRKFPYIKGEYWLSRKLPRLYGWLRPFLEVTEGQALEKIINQIRPDLVQSFEMQTCCYPIVSTLHKYPGIKWLYNCWGNDIFYYQDFPGHKSKISSVLSRVDYLTADSHRDSVLARSHGFKGKFMGVVPTGGGYDLSFYEPFRMPFEQRRNIIVKGYQHRFGRGLNSVKALAGMPDLLPTFDIVVFGAHKVVEDYVRQHKLPFQVFDRNGLSHSEVLKQMGSSAIYIGNNISDGMPNTLLEAMLMGAFPIQSNPGGATAEVITHGENGFLINDPESIGEIKMHIARAIAEIGTRMAAFEKNREIAQTYVGLALNKERIQTIYQQIAQDLCE